MIGNHPGGEINTIWQRYAYTLVDYIISRNVFFDVTPAALKNDDDRRLLHKRDHQRASAICHFSSDLLY